MKKKITIEMLRAIVWVGNHNADAANMKLCHDFVCDKSKPMAERIEALQIFDRSMGEETKTTEAMVHNYVADCS